MTETELQKKKDRRNPQASVPAIAGSAAEVEGDFLEQAIMNSVKHQLEAQGIEQLKPELAIGGEALPEQPVSFSIEKYAASQRDLKIRDTLKEPNSVNLEASRERLRLLEGINALHIGLDLADSVRAENALEKTLCHQLAACHRSAMQMLARAADERDSAQCTRFANLGGRLIETFQKGALTLQRLRTGGGQTVVVRHMTVRDGGQAVVANNVGGARKQRGEKRK